MTRTQKTILWVVFIALSLWRIFEIPAVANAFWAFCTVGALPWTDRTVSPDTVLKLLVMAFPLCLLLIFRKEFLAGVPRLPNRQPKSPVVIVLPIKARTPFRVRLAKADHLIGAVMDAEARLIRKIVIKTGRFARIAGYDFWQATLLSGQIIAKTVRFLGRVLLRLWSLIEPSIREFDHWLNTTLHKSRFISFLLDTGSELGRLATDGFHKVSAYTQRRLVRK